MSKILNEVCSIFGGGTPSRKEPSYFGGDICWATPTDITALHLRYIDDTKEKITKKGLANSSANLLPINSVLMTSRATIGSTAIARVPITTNQGIISFVCDETLLPEYLAYWLEKQHPLLMRLASGTTFKEISRTNVKNIKIDIPPLKEQQRIVEILDRAENIKRLRQQAIETTQRIAPALFYEMFGYPFDKKKELSRLGDYFTVQSGNTFPLRYQNEEGGEIPFYKVSDMNAEGNNEMLHRSNHYISEDTRIEMRAKTLGQYSIVFPKVGAAVKTNKKRMLTIPSCVDNNVMAVITNDEVEQFYVYCAFQFLPLTTMASDANPPSIRKSTVEDLGLLLPSTEEQREYFEAVRGVTKIQRQHVLCAKQAEQLSSALSAEVLAA